MSIQSASTTANRLEILLFRLNSPQLFGINVLKVKEIIPCPHLTQFPQSGHAVLGVAELRGHTLPVVDLAKAIGQITKAKDENCAQEKDEHKVIIAEFNRTRQGFLVSGVDRIIVSDWQDVLPPPSGLANGYITGVIRTDNGLVQIIDVEKVLGQTVAINFNSTDNQNIRQEIKDYMENRKVLIVDDSSLARTQTIRTLDQLGIPHLVAIDGREALDVIKNITRDCSKAAECIPMIISDIEMPEMDGYHLTREIRNEPRFQGMYILLHTSLDGKVNAEQAQLAGADKTLTKFVPELLAEAIIDGLGAMIERG